jgi:hypothetical protein
MGTLDEAAGNAKGAAHLWRTIYEQEGDCGK